MARGQLVPPLPLAAVPLPAAPAVSRAVSRRARADAERRHRPEYPAGKRHAGEEELAEQRLFDHQGRHPRHPGQQPVRGAHRGELPAEPGPPRPANLRQPTRTELTLTAARRSCRPRELTGRWGGPAGRTGQDLGLRPSLPPDGANRTLTGPRAPGVEAGTAPS